VEDVIEAVEHIALETQHVDPNTIPRPTRRKQVAPPTLPILDLHTRPAPVLTPNVSEEQADEDCQLRIDSMKMRAILQHTRKSWDFKYSKTSYHSFIVILPIDNINAYGLALQLLYANLLSLLTLRRPSHGW
jgi:hypothetical protein